MTPYAVTDRVELDISGMTCAACASRIERKLNKLEGVEASVSLTTDSAAVRFDPAHVALDDLVRAVEATGYGATPKGAAPSKRAATEHGRLSLRLALATALTVPLVLVGTARGLQFDGWEWFALVPSRRGS